MKPLRFLAAAHDDLMDLPAQVRHDFGYGLYLIQRGEMPVNASPVETFAGNEVMRLAERYDTDTYRCVFTAKFEKAIYVLHVFKKKSISGIATPLKDLEKVRARLKRAKELYAEEFENRGSRS